MPPEIPKDCLACIKKIKEMLACNIIGDVPEELLPKVRCWNPAVQNTYVSSRQTLTLKERGAGTHSTTLSIQGAYSGHLHSGHQDQ